MAKKNKNGIYLLILVVLIGIYLLVKYVINTAPDSNFDMSILSVDTAKITAITIKQPKDKDPLKLTKTNGEWKIQQGEKNAPADSNTVRGIFGVLADMNIQNVAATSKDKWKEFHLTDSLATEVRLFDATGQMVKDFYMGKFSYKQNQGGRMYGNNNITGLTYVRLANRDESFIVKGFLPMSFNRNFNDFRNQTIVRLDKNSIENLSFQYPADTGFVVAKTDSAVWMINQKDTADFTKVSQYLGILSWMRNGNFDDSFTPATDAVYTVQISGKTIQPVTVRVYQKDSVNYVINSTQNPKAFFVSNQNGILKRLLKTVGDFKK